MNSMYPHFKNVKAATKCQWTRGICQYFKFSKAAASVTEAHVYTNVAETWVAPVDIYLKSQKEKFVTHINLDKKV